MNTVGPYRQVGESRTLLIKKVSEKRGNKNGDVIRFGFGQSPFNPPQQLAEALAKNVARNGYTGPQGLAELRTALAHYYAQYHVRSSADDILIAPGSKILILVALLAHADADVLLPTPSWVSYEPQARLAGHTVIKLETDFETGWRVTPELLTAGIKKKKRKGTILILNYPGNPSGLTYTKEALHAIAAVARKNNILILSDEVYAQLTHDRKHTTIASIYPEGTLVTSGLSKCCGAGGYRFGYMILPTGIPAKLRSSLIGIASEAYSCAATPVQAAALSIFADTSPDITRHIKKQGAILSRVGNYCSKLLRESGVRVHDPEGGFYLFLDFSEHTESLRKRGITTGAALCDRLLKEEGVALLPGFDFGMPQSSLTARLAYVDFDDPMRESEFAVAKHCPRVVRGVKKITRWLEK